MLGMRKLNSAADLESRTTAPWQLPNMERILVTGQIQHLVLELSLLNFLALFLFLSFSFGVSPIL